SDYFLPKENSKFDKFIQYECGQTDLCGGWADRLKGVMSTYAISLLTDRQFKIKMTKNCDLKKILEPNEINWDYEQVPTKNITVKELNLGWNFGLYNLFKDDISLFTNLNTTNLIKVKAGMNYANRLRENSNLKEKIEKLGYEQSKFHSAYQFHKWYKQMFKLNKQTQKKYDEFLKKLKPNSHSKLICCQIRKGDPHEREYKEKYQERSFWNFINQTFLNSSNSSSNYRIFVTSDLEYVKLDAKNYFKNNEVFYSENSSVHLDKDLSKNECHKMESVLFDFHVMQNCDIGLVSHSGYGILALYNRPDPFKNFYVYSKQVNLNDPNERNNFFLNLKNLTFIKYTKPDDIYFNK
ncbi:unnamed protein product, partial [Brachionus calyciflorus]